MMLKAATPVNVAKGAEFLVPIDPFVSVVCVGVIITMNYTTQTSLTSHLSSAPDAQKIRTLIQWDHQTAQNVVLVV